MISIRDCARYSRGRYTPVLTYIYVGVAWALLIAWPIAGDSNITQIPVGVLGGRPIRWTPLWELLPALLAATAPAFVAPRLPTWEHFGSRSLTRYAATTAAVLVTGIGLLPLVSMATLPDGVELWPIVTNVVLVGGAAFAAVSVLGVRVGTLVALGVYVGLVALQHVSVELAVYVPFSGLQPNPYNSGNINPHPLAASTSAIMGVTLWAITLGSRRTNL